MNANVTSEPAVEAPLALTPQQESQWNDTMSMMMWTAPGFQHLFYKLLNAQHDGHRHAAVLSRETSYAATDQRNIMINPDTFFSKFTLPQRVFVLGHEIIHNIYDDVTLLNRCAQAGAVPMHDGTSLPFDMDTMQKSMDFRINALLIESKIGQAPKDCGNFDPNVTSQDSMLDIYKKEYKKKFPDGDGGDAEGKGNPGGFDNVLPPGKAPGQSQPQPRNQQQWAVETQAAQIIEQMRSQGKMAAALKRMFQTVLEPEIPWIDHITTLINRTVGDGGYDWTQPDPWFSVLDIYSPSPTGQGAGWIVIWGDTSGSRSDAELTSNMAELAGIMADVCPERLTVIWCDAAIEYIDEITDPMDLAHIQSRGTGGGGGTSMEPVLDWIAGNPDGSPDLFIGFTDGYVDFPTQEPRFPVIWASSTDHVYPFGNVVRVNKGK